MIKQLWTYGITLWSTAAKSNLKKVKIAQSKILRMILNAPWYVRSDDIREILDVPSVEATIEIINERH